MLSIVTPLPDLQANGRLRAGLWRALPAVIALMLAVVTAGLFALTSTKERSEAAEEAESDALLARESIDFQVGREIEALQNLASDVGRRSLSDTALRARFDVFMRRAGQVLSLLILDSQLHPSFAVQRAGAERELVQVPPALLESAARKSAEVERPIATAAFQASQSPRIALIVPTREAGSAGQFIVAVYSLDRLLDEMVPWNLAQDYEFTLSDATGTLRARRAAARPGRGLYTHQEPLEIAGTTLLLRADSVRGAPGWVANALRAGIASLALLLLWSLWALWRDHQHRRAAERLADEEAALRRAIGDCSVIGVSARDLDGRVRYVNPAFCRMIGYAANELIGQSPPAKGWLPPLDGEYLRHLEQHTNGNAAPGAFETQLVRRGGEVFTAAIFDAPLLDARRGQVGWTSSIVDLTQQKQTEERERLQQERLQTAARLTTMGELTSSLAHELNQPLGAIASYLAGSIAMLRHGDENRQELTAALTKASDQTQRAGQVIKRIHEFVRKQEPRRERVHLAEVIDSCRALIELQAKREAIQVEIAPNGSADLTVCADPIMLQQVVLNLTRNAIDAMSSSPPERRRLVISVDADATGATLSVRDFGPGIPDKDAERIFVPFFTTKSEGMGMGLSICRTIVQAHGGRLWFERRRPGTEFLLWLPRAD
jgi:two-component system, LuxR family, sensor histidine kinase DctS